MVVWGTRRKVNQLMTVSMSCKNGQRNTVLTLRRAQKKFTQRVRDDERDHQGARHGAVAAANKSELHPGIRAAAGDMPL
jgi:hypothetical protein